MSRKEMLKKVGLTEADLEPAKVTNKERIEAIEEAITELAELVLGGEADD